MSGCLRDYFRKKTADKVLVVKVAKGLGIGSNNTQLLIEHQDRPGSQIKRLLKTLLLIQDFLLQRDSPPPLLPQPSKGNGKNKDQDQRQDQCGNGQQAFLGCQSSPRKQENQKNNEQQSFFHGHGNWSG
jgi:hypothetical protein